MNKYLLLRDNKQSGPYTVDEIIQMGIKAYDLVWLEGKSAAWRYPSEVEELKPYAPAVEEQPFDRFYKKPAQPSEDHKRFEPAPAAPAVVELENSTKKVYINFPGGLSSPPVRKSKPAEAQPAVEAHEVEKTPPLFPEKTHNTAAAAVAARTDETYVPPAARNKSSDKKLLYGIVAACLLMLVFTAILLINNNRQRRNLKELNSIVQQLENNEKAQQASLPLPTVQNDAPPEPVSPAPAEPSPAEVVQEVTAAKNTGTKQKAPTAAPDKQDDAPIVFKESKPPAKPSELNEKITSPAATTENLYNLVNVEPNEYKVGLLGGISNLTFEVSNNSEVPLQRVSIEIKYLGPEKKVVRTQTVHAENISAGAQQTVEVPKSNRGVSISYSITNIKS